MYDCGSSMRTSQRSSLRFTLLITVLFCLSCPILSFLGSNFRLTSSSATQGHRLATASGVPLRKILNTRVPGTLGQLYMSSESALTTEEVSKYIEIQLKIKEVEKEVEAAQSAGDTRRMVELWGRLDEYKKFDPLQAIERRIMAAIARQEWDEAARLRQLKEAARAELEQLRALRSGPAAAAKAAAAAAEAEGVVDRLCVMAAQGSSIVTCKRDGSGVRKLLPRTELQELTRSGQLQQPTWSPDGQKIAFTAMRIGEGKIAEARLVIYNERHQREVYNAAFKHPPFYMQWSPDSKTLTFLAQGADGNVQMVSVDTTREAAAGGARLVDKGTPLFFATAAAAEGEPLRYLVHNGSKRTVTRVDPRTGAAELVCLTSGSMFMAPAAHRRGGRESVLVVEGGHLTSMTADGRGRGGGAEEEGGGDPPKKRLVHVKGFSTFLLSPDEQKVALMQQDLITGAYSVKLVRADGDALDPTSDAAVSQEDLPVGNILLAYFWSPDSTKLLCLSTNFGRNELALARNALKQGYNLKCRWKVVDVDTGKVTNYPEFTPRTFYIKVYLPFFDQYAQSYTPWSPDSQSFGYVSQEGAFVQRIGEEGPLRIAKQAEFSTWSWC